MTVIALCFIAIGMNPSPLYAAAPSSGLNTRPLFDPSRGDRSLQQRQRPNRKKRGVVRRSRWTEADSRRPARLPLIPWQAFLVQPGVTPTATDDAGRRYFELYRGQSGIMAKAAFVYDRYAARMRGGDRLFLVEYRGKGAPFNPVLAGPCATHRVVMTFTKSKEKEEAEVIESDLRPNRAVGVLVLRYCE